MHFSALIVVQHSLRNLTYVDTKVLAVKHVKSVQRVSAHWSKFRSIKENYIPTLLVYIAHSALKIMLIWWDTIKMLLMKMEFLKISANYVMLDFAQLSGWTGTRKNTLQKLSSVVFVTKPLLLDGGTINMWKQEKSNLVIYVEISSVTFQPGKFTEMQHTIKIENID